MPIRRRKLSGSADDGSIPGNTPEPGEDRFAGDPNEEPITPAASPEPSPKDRHPMPWGLVIHDVFNLDVHKTFKRLESELTLGDGATEYGTVLKAVDSSARNLYDAARLARKAKLEDESFGTKLDMRLEVLRSAAQRAIVEERQAQRISKAPTIQDIEDRMLASWPDEVLSIRSRKAEMHGALRVIEELQEAWKKRCSSVERLADQFKRAGA